MSLHRKKTGFSVIEILIASAIVGLALAALAGTGNLALRLQGDLKKNLIATNLATEALEAARAIRSEEWSLVEGAALDIPYHPVLGGEPAKWSLAAGQETSNGFTRQLVFSAVYRDAADDIVPSGGTLDSGTKKVIATVSWNEHSQDYQITLVSYLANWQIP